jgi:uncharacterized protein
VQPRRAPLQVWDLCVLPDARAAADAHDACAATALSVQAAAASAVPSRHTALHQAAAAGNVPLARTLLHLGAAVDARSKSGATPLFAACEAGHAPLAHTLLRAGADMWIPTASLENCLYIAALRGHREVRADVRPCMPIHAKPPAPCRGAPTACHMLPCPTALLRSVFVAAGAVCLLPSAPSTHWSATSAAGDTRPPRGWHACCTEEERAQVVELLLERCAAEGVAWEEPERYGDAWTPLMCCVVGGRVALAERLLSAAGPRAGALLRARNRHGQTALHLAAHRGASDMIQLLMAHGADGATGVWRARDASGLTPLQVARKHSQRAAEALLVRRFGAEI